MYSQGEIMKKLALIVAAAATLGFAIPASAQGLSVRIGDGMHRGGMHHGERHHDRMMRRDHMMRRDRGWHGHHDRVVIMRHR
jgi:Spy/CpxP family protein refolding chaperone